MRVLWMATELSLEFEHVPYEFDDPTLKTPAFLELNPTGAIPTLVDGEMALSESLAINLYLAKRYGREGADALYPDTAEAEAQAIRWTLFAQGHLEPWVQKDALLADLIEAIGDRADGMVAQSLGVLERVLSDSLWLLGDTFTVADLNVAAVLSPSRASLLELSDYPHVQQWLTRCYERPAARAARRLFESSASGQELDSYQA
jgi:glutathione S-transferase